MSREIQPELINCMLSAGIARNEIYEAMRSCDCAVYRLLERRRRQLLDDIHDRESLIAQIDYIEFQLKKDACTCKENKDGE